MPLPTIADVYRVGIHQTMGDIDMWNVIHVRADGTGGELEICEAVEAAWVADTSFWDIQTGYVNYVETTALALFGSSPATFVHAWGEARTTGSDGAAITGPQVCFVHTLRTLLGGRSHRGRMYICGVSTDHTTNEGTAWDLSEGSMNIAGATFLSELNGDATADCTLVVASYTLASAEPVTEMVPRIYMGTQRRRTA